MHKTHIRICHWLTSALLTTTTTSCIEITPVPRHDPSTQGDGGTSMNTVTLSFSACSVEDADSMIPYPTPSVSGEAVSLTFPSNCHLLAGVSDFRWRSESARMVCKLNDSAALDKIISADDFYIEINESYWLPTVQLVGDNKKAFGSGVYQGRISLKVGMDHELSVPGVRSSGLFLGSPVFPGLEEKSIILKLKKTQMPLVAEKNAIFYVPSVCQLNRISENFELLNSTPQWNIKRIRISSSPYFD